MKLVEILARELEVWPEGAQELGQWPAGEICIRAASTGHPCTEVYTSTYIADDVDAWCTRPQWQAERDRMKTMEEISKFSQEQDQMQARSKDEAQYVEGVKRIQDSAFNAALKELEQKILAVSDQPTYEQQLWDRAAVAATQAFITAHITHFGHENVWQDKELVSCAADYADAFMAERAKRVGK